MTTEDVRGDLTILTLSVALAFVILFGLGTWQLDRKAKKEVLLEQIQARATADAIVLDAAVTLFNKGEDLEYTPVRARGKYMNDKAMFYYASGPAGPGYHVYTPLVGPSGVVLTIWDGQTWLPPPPRSIDLGVTVAPFASVNLSFLALRRCVDFEELLESAEVAEDAPEVSLPARGLREGRPNGEAMKCFRLLRVWSAAACHAESHAFHMTPRSACALAACLAARRAPMKGDAAMIDAPGP